MKKMFMKAIALGPNDSKTNLFGQFNNHKVNLNVARNVTCTWKLSKRCPHHVRVVVKGKKLTSTIRILHCTTFHCNEKHINSRPNFLVEQSIITNFIISLK